MQKTLKEFVDQAYEFQASQINGSDPTEDSMPHFIAEDDKGELHILATPWRDDEEKAGALRAVRKYFFDHNVVRYVAVTEAWSLTIKKGDEPPTGRVSDHPRREDVLICCGVDQDGEIYTRVEMIVIADDGKRHLDPNRDLQIDGTAGTMTRLLVREGSGT